MQAVGRAKAPEPEPGNLDPTDYNVEAIARAERVSLHERTAAERFSDSITRLLGSMGFVIFHVLLFSFWAAVNLELIPGIAAFDPFPFGILTLLVSAEGVFIAIFILISQNRMSRLSERRNHLNLQVSMLAEQELTTLLRMQKKLCDRMGVDVGPMRDGAERLMEETNVEELIEELKERLPEA